MVSIQRHKWEAGRSKKYLVTVKLHLFVIYGTCVLGPRQSIAVNVCLSSHVFNQEHPIRSKTQCTIAMPIQCGGQSTVKNVALCSKCCHVDGSCYPTAHHPTSPDAFFFFYYLLIACYPDASNGHGSHGQ